MLRILLCQLILLIGITLNITLTPLTTQPIVTFQYLAATIISQQSPSIYTIQNDPIYNASSLKKYIILDGVHILKASYNFDKQNLKNWALFQLKDEILAFPYQASSQIVILDKNALTVKNKISNQWNFLKIIQSKKYNVIFFSTNNGKIYFCSKNANFSNFVSLTESRHIGNTYLSLSPDQSYLCSTDQYTGYVTIWSVPVLRKLYEYSTPESGIRAHSWHINSQILYAYGYYTGNYYEFSTKNSLQLITLVQSNLTYITSCFYLYETQSLMVFSYNLSSVISFSTVTYDDSLVVVYPGAEIIQADATIQYFTVFNNTSASYYKINSLCLSKQYFDLNTNQCQPCGLYCLTCKPNICLFCSQGYQLSSDNFNCLQPVNSTTQNITTKYSQLAFLNQSSTFIINITLSFINGTFQIPGHRQFLNMFFELFSSFDHLYLYIYHNRTFGPNMKFYLQLIHDTIDYRFNIINNQLCKTYLGIDFNQWKQNIDFKSNYSSPQFLKVEGNGEGLFVNNLQYFFLNIPLIVVTVFIAKGLFHLLFNYKVSLFFRKFQFTGIIILSLIQGNVQLFFFSFTADFLTLFSPNLKSKLINASTILVGWLFLSLSTVGIFSLYLFYKKRSKFLLQNCKGTYNSMFYTLMVNGIMNMIRGIIHRVLLTFPQQQVAVLMMVQLVQIGIHCFSIKRYKFIESSFILILFMVSNFTRVAFNFSLLFQTEKNIHFLDQIHTLIVFVVITVVFLGILYSINELLQFIKKAFQIQVQKCKLKKQIVVEQHMKNQLISKPNKKNSTDTLKHQPRIEQQCKTKFARKKVKFDSEEPSIGQKIGFNTTKQIRKQQRDHSTVRVKKARNVLDTSKHLNIVFAKK